jgi:hypothetical protein
MQRRNFLQLSSLLGLVGLIRTEKTKAAEGGIADKFPSDRAYWVSLLQKISAPVLDNMSKGELRKNMKIEVSPTWDGRPKDVAYMEAFGRLIAGIAPICGFTRR